MEITTAATADGFKEAVKDEKYKYLDKFGDICELLLDNMDYEKEYYPTCESVFAAVEEKRLNIEHIVSKSNYADFKKKVIDYDFPCLAMGKAPESEYSIATSKGYKKYAAKYNHSEHLML